MKLNIAAINCIMFTTPQIPHSFKDDIRRNTDESTSITFHFTPKYGNLMPTSHHSIYFDANTKWSALEATGGRVVSVNERERCSIQRLSNTILLFMFWRTKAIICLSPDTFMIPIAETHSFIQRLSAHVDPPEPHYQLQYDCIPGENTESLHVIFHDVANHNFVGFYSAFSFPKNFRTQLKTSPVVGESGQNKLLISPLTDRVQFIWLAASMDSTSPTSKCITVDRCNLGGFLDD